jgi:hypothetical protein
VQVEIKDEQAARDAMKHLGLKGTLTKSGSGFIFTPDNAGSFDRGKFLQEYGVSLAQRKARSQGWMVTRKEVGNEVRLVMRQQ